jgi:hypothetical protein
MTNNVLVFRTGPETLSLETYRSDNLVFKRTHQRSLSALSI